MLQQFPHFRRGTDQYIQSEPAAGKQIRDRAMAFKDAPMGQRICDNQ